MLTMAPGAGLAQSTDQAIQTVNPPWLRLRRLIEKCPRSFLGQRMTSSVVRRQGLCRFPSSQLMQGLPELQGVLVECGHGIA